jgi:hypothetical protein
VAQNKATVIQQNWNIAGCTKYWFAAGITIGSFNPCNCIDYAARQWNVFVSQNSTGGYEDMRPQTGSHTFPDDFVDLIKSKNSTGQFARNGDTIP